MHIAHPTSTGVIATGAYKVFGITVTPSGTDDASITIVDSADGSGSPDVVDTITARTGEKTLHVSYIGGIDVKDGIYVSALSGTSATFGVQFDGA